MAIVCDKCGAKSETPEAFYKRHRSFRTELRNECPRCYAESQLSGLKVHLWASLLSGVAGAGFAWKAPELSIGWVLLNLFFFQVFLIASILPHELGHALTARWLGYRVFKIYVGFGRTLLTRDLFGFQTEFRVIPLGGLTIATPVSADWFRLKQFAFILAGPFANFLLCAGVLLFIPLHDALAFDRIFHGLPLGQVFLWANVIILGQNLWPRTFDSPVGELGTDGKLLLQTPFAKPDVIANFIAARFAMEAATCHERQQYAEALAWIEQGLAQYPDNVALLNWRGILQLESGDYEAARQSFIALLNREHPMPGYHAFLLNNIAYVDALLGGAERLEEADRYSQEAFSAIGWIPAVKGTRGTTLLEMGRVDEALPLLRASMQEADNPGGKAQNACFIAIGEARRGNLNESRRYLEQARKLNPTCFLLERAEEAFRAASSGLSGS